MNKWVRRLAGCWEQNQKENFSLNYMEPKAMRFWVKKPELRMPTGIIWLLRWIEIVVLLCMLMARQ